MDAKQWFVNYALRKITCAFDLYAFICSLISNNNVSQLMANRVGYHDNTYILICET